MILKDFDNLKTDTALMLFRKRRLSFGKATKLVGISKWEFMELTAKRKSPWVNQLQKN